MKFAPFAFALLSLLSAALFWADLRGYFNVARKPVAFVRALHGSARRLGNGELTWDRAHAGTLFADGDMVASGSDSRVKVAFYAGGEVDLEPGAMVRLGGDQESLKLSFVQGEGKVKVSKKAEGKVEVRQERPGADAEVNTENDSVAGAPIARSGGAAKPARRAARVEVALVEDAEVAVTAAEASASAAAANGSAPVAAPAAAAKAAPVKEAPIAPIAAPIQAAKIKNPALSLVTTGSLVKAVPEWIPPAPKLLEPAPNSTLVLNDAIIPELQWSLAAKSGEKVRYEIFLKALEGAGGERVLQSESPHLTVAELPAGRYAWSVRAVRADGKRGPASEERPVRLKLLTQLNKPKIRPVEVE